jgi:hypothetical protein
MDQKHHPVVGAQPRLLASQKAFHRLKLERSTATVDRPWITRSVTDLAQVQRIWSEYLPEINLVAPIEAVAYKAKFGNLRPSALPPRATWNAEEIYVKK